MPFRRKPPPEGDRIKALQDLLTSERRSERLLVERMLYWTRQEADRGKMPYASIFDDDRALPWLSPGELASLLARFDDERTPEIYWLFWGFGDKTLPSQPLTHRRYVSWERSYRGDGHPPVLKSWFSDPGKRLEWLRFSTSSRSCCGSWAGPSRRPKATIQTRRDPLIEIFMTQRRRCVSIDGRQAIWSLAQGLRSIAQFGNHEIMPILETHDRDRDRPGTTGRTARPEPQSA